jgi:hypothetical protein
MKCPACGCEKFYVKNPDDHYDISEFTCNDGHISFEDDIDEDDAPQISDSTEAYCNKCAWHGKIEK